jgi:hypothetical protein
MTMRKAPFEDLELMRYHDDELDDEHVAALEEWLDEDDDARDKLAGMEIVGGLLREMAHEDRGVDDIVEAVMAGLDAGETKAGEIGAGEVDEEEASDKSPAEPRPVPKLGPVPKLSPVPKQGAPANDNSSWIFMAAGLAAAAAAGLFFWGKQPVEEPLAGRTGPTAMATEAAPAPTGRPTAAVASEEDAPASEGVEIAAVDFGAHTGSVFYVSGGTKTGRSAVVWITDAGGE